MELMKTIKVKNLNGTFEQDVPLGSDTVYVSRQWYNPETGNAEEITLEQSLVEIENDITRINGDSETIGSIDYKVADAITKLIDGANDVYNSLYKIQLQIEDNVLGGIAQGNGEGLYNTLFKVNNKLNQLDGSGTGSIDERIAAAIDELKGGVSTALDTLEEIEELFNSIKSNDAEGLDSLAELAEAYNNLKTLVGTLPADYEGATIVQYIQDLVDTEENRAKQQEKSLFDMIESVNNLCASEMEKIDTKVNNLHGIIVSWDGDTSELRYETDGTNYWYQVSADILTYNDLLGKTVKFTYQEQVIEFTIAEEYLNNSNTNYVEVIYNSTVLILCQNENALNPGIYLLNDSTNACYIQEIYSKIYASAENEHIHNNKDILDNLTSTNLNHISYIPEMINNINTLTNTVDNQHTPQISLLNSTVSSLNQMVNTHDTNISNMQIIKSKAITVGSMNEVTLNLIMQGNMLRVNLVGTLTADWISGQTWDSFGTLASLGIDLVPSILIRRYVIINKNRMGILRITTSGEISLGYIFNINTSQEDTLVTGDNIRVDEVFFLDSTLANN